MIPALLDTLTTLPIEIRTGLILLAGALVVGPLAIWLGWITGNACSPLLSDCARFADRAVETRILNEETV